jgi:electron transfer flavoprotein beta subunit
MVAVKRVIDYQVKVRVRPDGRGIETQNVKMSLNPFDEIALEEALRMKEQGHVKEILAISIGPLSVAESLRQALAMGADHAVHLLIDESLRLEPAVIAKLLSEQIKAQQDKQQTDLVMMGKQAIDDDCHQTPQMLAAYLNWPQATCVSKLVLGENTDVGTWLGVTEEVDGGLCERRIKLPAVVSVDLRLNEPRFVSLPNLMKAKAKPIQTIPIDLSLVLDGGNKSRTLKYETPPSRIAGKKYASIKEILQLLHQQGDL